MTGFMLDTDICSYIIKRRPATLVEKFEKHAEMLNVSVITAAELRFGAHQAARPKLTELVEAYLERLAILDWTNEVTPHYARIRPELERSGKPIGNMDLLIAWKYGVDLLPPRAPLTSLLAFPRTTQPVAALAGGVTASCACAARSGSNAARRWRAVVRMRSIQYRLVNRLRQSGSANTWQC
jgi:tRNA(fMet)-specific endonuclease VapC